MSEVNGPKIGVNQFNFQGVQKPVSENNLETERENNAPKLNDFSDSRAEALGRTMLFKENDSVSSDLKVLLESPQVAENSDEVFEAAYMAALENGVDNPYEAAATVATTPLK